RRPRARPRVRRQPGPPRGGRRLVARARGGPREPGARRAARPPGAGLRPVARRPLPAARQRARGRPGAPRAGHAPAAAPRAEAPRGAAGGGPRGRPERRPELEPARPVAARTVHESLFRHALAEPDRPTVYLREDDGPEETITYGRLWREASLVAGGLREKGIARGDTVALMLPTGLDFLRSFQGILVAGAVPVPIYPPLRLARLEEYAARQPAILADAGVRLLITIPRAMPIAGMLRPSVPSLAEVATADDLAAPGAVVSGPEGRGGDPAFVQYTSGSTGS